MNDLQALVDVSQPFAFAAFLAFLRVGAFAALLPAFGEQTLPMRVRLAVALALTTLVLPAVVDQLPAQPDSLAATGHIVVIEVAAGLVFGLGVRLLVWALEFAGALASQSVGVAQLFGSGMTAEPSSAFSQVFVLTGFALACAMGLPLHAVAMMIGSYSIIPSGSFPTPDLLAATLLPGFQNSFGLAVRLAGPFFIAGLLYNLTLGFVNRAMPQMMVTFVGAPALTGAGLILLLVASPVLLGIWVRALIAAFATPFGPSL
ncbi:flagellar biosynthetic protein FliR [Ketogulonicigenium robustum]|uniref:Flagellar biosynthetic protein FliR n=1 Tax=Ketogulonicigenium robustum TaxID=92947 RepID=A0A1W6P1M4_9RHOB|nr:flagellar biosynthetic protein FliR [Ketogulonicigenium robustum]ARO15415.1 flagellar biosynthetic protein FliR [Ketogulonicigenium robustum]